MTARLVEILVYKLTPGSGAAFFTLMRDVSVPLHVRHGIDVIWHGQSLHDPDAYVLLRAFDDLASLDQAQAAFYASDDWRQGPRAAIIASIAEAQKVVIPMGEAAIAGLRADGFFKVPA